MKGILIDVINREVREVETEGGLDSLYKLIGCDLVEIVKVDRNEDLYVDEEGLLKVTSKSGFFTWFTDQFGVSTPLVGNGLILSHDDEGNSISTTHTVEDSNKRVTFYTYPEVSMMVV